MDLSAPLVLAEFEAESFDHIPDDVMYKIVSTMKPYELQYLAELVWYNRDVPCNRNIRPSLVDDASIDVRLYGKWITRQKDEIVLRMVQRMVTVVSERMKDKVPKDNLAWLENIPRNKKHVEAAFAFAGLHKLIGRVTPITHNGLFSSS